MIRRATPDDAEAIASVLNTVTEGETALTNPFTVEDERVFIEGLCVSALFVAGGRHGIQSIEPDASARYTDSMRHVAVRGNVDTRGLSRSRNWTAARRSVFRLCACT